MPRRHGWLQDYHYALDQGQDRTVRGFDGPIPTKEISGDSTSEKIIVAPAASPANITININLGDMLDKIVNGRSSTKEAIEEIAQSSSSKKRLED